MVSTVPTTEPTVLEPLPELLLPELLPELLLEPLLPDDVGAGAAWVPDAECVAGAECPVDDGCATSARCLPPVLMRGVEPAVAIGLVAAVGRVAEGLARCRPAGGVTNAAGATRDPWVTTCGAGGCQAS